MVLVSKSEMPMIDIAIECGYECPGSFTRAFKLAFGSNPTLIRGMASRTCSQFSGEPRGTQCRSAVDPEPDRRSAPT